MKFYKCPAEDYHCPYFNDANSNCYCQLFNPQEECDEFYGLNPENWEVNLNSVQKEVEKDIEDKLFDALVEYMEMPYYHVLIHRLVSNKAIDRMFSNALGIHTHD